MIDYKKLQPGDIVVGRKGGQRKIIRIGSGQFYYVSRKSPEAEWRTKPGDCWCSTIMEWGDHILRDGVRI